MTQGDELWDVTKKITPLCILLPLLGTGLSYIAYAKDVAASNIPWSIGAIVTLLCIALPFVIFTLHRGTGSLKAYGSITMVGVAATYFFFGVFGFFFYFGFAPLPPVVRLAGIAGGVVLNIVWAVMSAKAVRHTLTTTSFVKNAFTETDSRWTYSLRNSMARFDKLHKERSPFPKIVYWAVMGISPFCLILNRLLSPAFGGSGVLFVIAVLAMPMSLWIISLFARLYLVMVDLPNQLERQHGKPVVVVE
jgi:hypothetical protein